MSELTSVNLDNQFIAIGRPKAERPQDNRSILDNLRKPFTSPPETKRYIGSFGAATPTAAIALNLESSENTKEAETSSPVTQDFFDNLDQFSDSVKEQKKVKKVRRFKLPKMSRIQIALLCVAVLLFLVGGYSSFVGWRSAKVAQSQAASLTKIANNIEKSGVTPTGTSPTNNPAVATTPISTSTLADYTVAPNMPRYIIIPKLGVDARVLSVGVTSSGALGTPDNVYDTAWYNESAEPGQPGAMLIDGHVSSWTANGVFYGIKTLVAGDIIKVERGDGTIFTYSVVKSQVYPSGNVNMQAAMTPIVSGQPGLNLITCTGDVISGTNTFNERIIVFATQISS